MRKVTLVLALLAGLAGCQNGFRRAGCDNCLPPCCPAQQGNCRAPEEIVVHAPRQKIVVEVPPAAAPQPAAAPPQPAAAPPQPAAAPPQLPAAFPQAAMMPPAMMPMMAYGQGYAAPSAPVLGQVRERTGIGFAFDTFKIPIPFLRPIAVQRPASVTLQMPLAQAPPVGYAAPMAMPMAPMMSPVAMPAYQAPVAMPAYQPPQYAMIPQASIGYQQVTTQAQVPFQQVAQFQGAAPPPQQPQQRQAPQAAPPSSADLAEQLRQCQEKLKALQEMKKCSPEVVPPARCN